MKKECRKCAYFVDERDIDGNCYCSNRYWLIDKVFDYWEIVTPLFRWCRHWSKTNNNVYPSKLKPITGRLAP